jgi:cyclopropane fatty-acyl-phospholipid synthase-like methyltransferase
MGSTPLAYFDRMYEDADPWGYESSWYEQRKYALTVAALGRRRYRSAFEPGCSIGVLTLMLAARCDRLLAADFHEGAISQARRRLAGHDHVGFRQLDISREWPVGVFDLIVLSEVAYYLDRTGHLRLIDRVDASLTDDGEVVLVHWRGETDYPQTGDAVHDAWSADPRFRSVVSHVEHDFRLDVVQRARR